MLDIKITFSFNGGIFSLTKRFLWPAFSDYAHFSFLTFLCFPMCGELSIKQPTSKFHYLYFFSDILVVSYVLSGVPRTCRSVSAFAP